MMNSHFSLPFQQKTCECVKALFYLVSHTILNDKCVRVGEGLDLPGELLENLVITKIPFGVPTSPVEQAHSEYIEKKGGNPFMQITVPDASKKLIQSVGRLLRKERDSGRVTILDRRLVTKRYGQALIDSLPPFKRKIEY